MAKTEIRGGQILDETITSADIGPNAVGNSELDNSGDFTMNSLTITTTSTLSGDVGVGGAPVTDAALAITSISKAFKLPTLDTTARDAIGTPIAGMLIFNTSTSTLQFYSSSWGELTVTETDPLSLHINGDNSPSSNIDWNQFEIEQLVVHKLSADPGSPVEGQIWYNTTTKQWSGYNGTNNVLLG